MKTLPLVIHPDERLRLVSEPVQDIDGDIISLVEGMFEVMYKSSGFGLAGIQVGVAKRVVVMDLARREGESFPQVFINPEIIHFGEEVTSFNEGCLSLPNLYIDVDRPETIQIKYMDLEGKQHIHEANELLARCFQHEVDHLNGLLIFDRVSRLKKQLALKKYKKMQSEKETPEEE